MMPGDLRAADKATHVVVGRKVVALRLVYVAPNGALLRTSPVSHTRWN